MNDTVTGAGSARFRRTGEPRAEYRRWLESAPAGDSLLRVDFQFQPWWLEEAQPLSLAAIYLLAGGQLNCTVTDKSLEEDESLSPAQQYQAWVEQYGLYSATPGQPLPLRVTPVPKPWGRELWYTGVEERGVCEVGTTVQSVPIPWLQAVLPDDRAGPPGRPLVLLKVLDPAPEEVTGDLYFELHEEKREVYVVTHVDERAWPGGTGYIRYGFDPAKVAAADTGDDFRAEYLAAVQAYEAVRRAIDDQRNGDPVDPGLLRREVELRRAMESFTHMRPLQVGDVVVVPLNTPHSLQHGVRTIEFQTPVYERKILSFAQRVLTQGHWDTREAVQVMQLHAPAEEPFERLYQAQGVLLERIVDFEDFEVHRLSLASGASYELPPLDRYRLLMTVAGHCPLDGVLAGPEEAAILPAGYAPRVGARSPQEELVVLLAQPRS